MANTRDPRLAGPGGDDLASLLTPADFDLGSLDQAQRDVIKKTNPALARQLETLELLESQIVRAKAETAAGFATEDPEMFFGQVLGKRPTEKALALGLTSPLWEGQQRVVESVQKNKRTAVPSGHTVGKTLVVAWLVLWFLYGLAGSVVVTTAPTWHQVETLLWSEIRTAHRGARIPLQGRCLETQIKVSDTERWFAIGLSTDDESRFQGFHGKRRTMIVFDEATGVREELWDSAESMVQRAEDRFVAIGNPTNPSSRFKTACDSGRFHVVRLDCRDHPNVKFNDPDIIPGAVTKEWVDERLDEYGSEDSPLFRARVAGLWPGAGGDSLVDLAWVERAMAWRKEYPHLQDSLMADKGDVLGLDVAGPGADLAVCTRISRGVLSILWWTSRMDLMDLVGRVVQTVHQGAGAVKTLAIDDTGIGNGVSSRLFELQRLARPDSPGRVPLQVQQQGTFSSHLAALRIIRVNFGQESPDPRYHRVKDYMWWRMRESLQKGHLGLPSDAEFRASKFPRGHSLTAQLSTPIYEILGSSGKIKVWDRRDGDREKTRALSSRSPDIAHSSLLALHGWKGMRVEVDEGPEISWEQARKQQLAEIFRNVRAGAAAEKAGPEYGPEAYKYL